MTDSDTRVQDKHVCQLSVNQTREKFQAPSSSSSGPSQSGNLLKPESAYSYYTRARFVFLVTAVTIRTEPFSRLHPTFKKLLKNGQALLAHAR